MAKFDAHLKCSFCGKAQDQVRKLIAGPGVYICDECIDLCNEILDEELLDSQGQSRQNNEQKNKNSIGMEIYKMGMKHPQAFILPTCRRINTLLQKSLLY